MLRKTQIRRFRDVVLSSPRSHEDQQPAKGAMSVECVVMLRPLEHLALDVRRQDHHLALWSNHGAPGRFPHAGM